MVFKNLLECFGLLQFDGIVLHRFRLILNVFKFESNLC